MKNICESVGEFLLSYNFPTSINGYHYSKEGIVYHIRNGSVEGGKVLFSHIAEKFNTVTDNVERCIRTFINVSKDSIAQTGIFITKPSAREFIFKCAEYINLKDEKVEDHLAADDYLALDFIPDSVYDILTR